jgi:hypothetical protein
MSNHLPRIDEVSVDEGGDGVMSVQLGNTHFPLIAADPARLASLIPMAKDAAAAGRTVVRLVKFTTREEIDVYGHAN